MSDQVDGPQEGWKVRKPWQVVLHYTPALAMLTMRVGFHTHGSIAFTDAAADYCGGAAERDADGYIVRCHDEHAQVEIAREIARMSAAT